MTDPSETALRPLHSGPGWLRAAFEQAVSKVARFRPSPDDLRLSAYLILNPEFDLQRWLEEHPPSDRPHGQNDLCFE